MAVLWAHGVQGEESPYAAMTDRETKALSPQQVEQYLEGGGMGLALAGELNGYPGPKHVLELAQELGISLNQLRNTQRVFERMQTEAQRLGREIVEREMLLDALFADDRIDAPALVQLTEDIGRLNGRLRGVHLSAHLEMKEVLSLHQRERYQALRGYDEPQEHAGHGGQQ